ncbi:MAG: hypothetical protein D6730_24595 [Bacteroidetes bacterium]|nr:MAG: hypothetical protein D6730_24595 [Bacteroidota bacterium]
MQAYTWIYSLNTPLDEANAQALQADFDQFTSQWKSHGTPVDGLIRLAHGRFVIIQADPAVPRPSGCSIDSLKRAVAQILQHHGLESLDAAYIGYRDAQGHIQFVHFKQLPQLIAKGEIGPDTLVFDHSLDQSDDLSKWEVPLRQSWMSRYLSVKQ